MVYTTSKTILVFSFCFLSVDTALSIIRISITLSEVSEIYPQIINIDIQYHHYERVHKHRYGVSCLDFCRIVIIKGVLCTDINNGACL